LIVQTKKGVAAVDAVAGGDGHELCFWRLGRILEV
jgi:hypothetical protein